VIHAALFVALALATGLSAGADSPAAPTLATTFDARTVFQQAGDDFKKAVDLAATDPAAAVAPAARAAAAYRQIALRTGVRNHALEINAGNASLLAGDLGHAVAAFRRAERIAPRAPSVQASLAAARARVGLRLEPDARARVFDTLLSWRGKVGRSMLIWIALGAYLGAWAAAASRHWCARPSAWVGVTLGIIALAAGAPLAADDFDRRASRDGVIIAPEVIGRSGPGEGLYEPSFKQPLRAGVECSVLEDRGPWSRVRLIDGRETWVPAGAVERL